MSFPEISLIIPVYNIQNFVGEALESVRNQTLSPLDYEVIVFDDCSIDNTPNIVQEQIKGMKNTKFFQGRKNGGLAVARNEGIERAESKIIALLDGDDILEPHALKSTLEFMSRNRNVKYSYSMFKTIDEEGKHVEAVPGREYDPELLLHMNYIGHIQCFTKKINKRIGGYVPGLLGEDWDHVLKASEILGKKGIAQNQDYNYKYRINRTGSICNGQVSELMDARIDIITRALARRGIKDVEVFWSHKERGRYNYMDWKKRNNQQKL